LICTVFAVLSRRRTDNIPIKLSLFSKPNQPVHSSAHRMDRRIRSIFKTQPRFETHYTNQNKQYPRQTPISFETRPQFETHSTKKNEKQRNTTMRPLKRLQMISFSLTLLIGISSAFATMNTPSRSATSNKRHRVSRTKRYFTTDFSVLESFSSLLDLQSSMASTTSSATMLSPDVEAEVLTAMSHMVMDFSGFFGPSKPLLRLCSVLGRILVIGADYLPDQNVQPGELAIQLVLLAINLNDVVKAVLFHQTPCGRN
jgi:hypothetical protein